MNFDKHPEKQSHHNALKVPEDFDYEYVDSDDEYQQNDLLINLNNRPEPSAINGDSLLDEMRQSYPAQDMRQSFS